MNNNKEPNKDEIIIPRMPYDLKKGFFYYLIIQMLKNGKLTDLTIETHTLNNMGLSSKYINKLISDGIIERVERGKYKLSSTIVELLFAYGATEAEEENEEIAVDVLDVCYKIDPVYVSSKSFLCFCELILNKESKEAIELYEELSARNYYFLNDFRYYLLLLDRVKILPRTLQLHIANFTSNKGNDDIYELIKIQDNDPRYKPLEIEDRNNIRRAALDYNLAISVDDLERIICMQTPQDTAEKKIISKLIEDAKNTKKTADSIDDEFLDSLYQRIKISRIILLEPMSYECIKRITESIKERYPDVLVEQIESRGKKQIFLRLFSKNQNFNGKDAKSIIQSLYIEGFLDSSRNLFYELLAHSETLDELPTIYYGRAANIEKRFGNYDQAATLFEIARSLAKTPSVAVRYQQEIDYLLHIRNNPDTGLGEYLPNSTHVAAPQKVKSYNNQ